MIPMASSFPDGLIGSYKSADFAVKGKKKGRLNIGRPLKALTNPDEQFHVVLRTRVSIHRSNNGLHGGTSISWTSPPFPNLILKPTLPPVKGELYCYLN